MAGKFELFKDSRDEYRFRLKAGNGEIILRSEGYTTKAGAENGIDSVKINAPVDARYDRKMSSNGKYYFNLLAANNQVIGTSEMYETAAGRDNGIESVKSNAPTAVIDDLT
ncbi:MAG: YegP family protein [Candidatus Poribacteria bacterium]|nr:YegP family protein [Candidatus Poribacteria bacterium]